METSLHRDLKKLYAGDASQTEVRLGPYRIDAVVADQLVEIQHGSLAAIRDKVRALLVEHDVLIVKPIVARKTILKLHAPGGKMTSRRTSPKRGSLVDLFDELVYFTRVFPHPRLTIEAVLVEVEESRYPGHGRRRRWRKTDHVVEDQRLLTVGQSCRLQTAADLVRMLDAPLPARFHTGQLAAALGVRRWIAQRIAYCLRETKAIEQCGKQGNALVYRVAKSKKPKRGDGRAA